MITMGVRGTRQGPIPHQTRRSHWVGLNSMSFSWGALAVLSVAGGSSGGNGWPLTGVVTAGLAHQTPYSPEPWPGWASPDYGAG